MSYHRVNMKKWDLEKKSHLKKKLLKSNPRYVFCAIYFLENKTYEHGYDVYMSVLHLNNQYILILKQGNASVTCGIARKVRNRQKCVTPVTLIIIHTFLLIHLLDLYCCINLLYICIVVRDNLVYLNKKSILSTYQFRNPRYVTGVTLFPWLIKRKIMKPSTMALVCVLRGHNFLS